ncbi:MAG: hypothetical protein OEY24_06600 [Candidatus Bathyarchaeota archaeon]|nr:hypothetical protein [Candidatus Bathyarchaeota archaeon]MDH5495353.1 hypothetical protein [Candidatus Bathyarchaeota archaeon]
MPSSILLDKTKIQRYQPNSHATTTQQPKHDNCRDIPETQKTLKVSLRRGSKIKTNLATLAEVTATGLVQASGGDNQDTADCILRNEDVSLWKKNTLQHLRRTLS